MEELMNVITFVWKCIQNIVCLKATWKLDIEYVLTFLSSSAAQLVKEYASRGYAPPKA